MKIFKQLLLILFSTTLCSIAYAYINQSLNSSIAEIFIHNNWLLLIPIFWVFGILLGLTPCAILLILMMTNITGKHSPGVTTQKSVTVTFIYLLTLGLSYAAVGIATSLIGLYLYNYLYNIWVIILLSLLFLFLGLISLGLFNVSIFSRSLLQRFIYYTRWHMIGPYASAVMMGLFGTLMASRCTAAPLAGVLSFVAYKSDWEFGAIALFFIGIGFGMPLLAVNLFGSDITQVAGKWQETIKHFFGLGLIAVSIWLLDGIVKSNVTMFLWSALAIFSPIYLGAMIADEKNITQEAGETVCSLDGEEESTPNTTDRYLKTVLRMLGVMVLLYGIALFIGALYGNSNPLSPLK